MNTDMLDIKFARIGARLKVVDRPSGRNRTTGVISLDVQSDRRGEFFEIVCLPGAEAEIAVLDVQSADRHLLLLVREGLRLLRGANGIAALTFCEVPILP